MENNLNLGTVNVGTTAPASTPTTTTQTSAAPASTAGTTTPSASASMSTPTDSRYKVVIDGEEKEVGLNDLITGYQKVSASDKRFQEAATMRKEAERYEKAIQNLESIIKAKDFDRFSQVVGDDFVSDFLSAKTANERHAAGMPLKYSEEDVRLAQELGIEVSDLVQARSKATGADIPIVNTLQAQYKEATDKLNKMAEYVAQLENEFKVNKIEYVFKSLKDKYPNADVKSVIDTIERENKNVEDFETVFKIEEELAAKKLEAAHNKYLEMKKIQASNAVPTSGTADVSIVEDEFKGLSGQQKVAKLKEKLKNL